MSTPRKRWFKVADSILREDWDDATLAASMRLMAWFNQRWARDGIPHSEAGSAVIGEHDAMLITHLRRPKDALKRLARLPLVAGWTSASATLDSDQSPTRCTLKWSKFPKFQEYGPRSRAGDGPENSPSDSDSSSPAPSLKGTPMQSRAAPGDGARDAAQAPDPEPSTDPPEPPAEPKPPSLEAEVGAVWPQCRSV